jgi:ABC-2 type transport system permease protein
MAMPPVSAVARMTFLTGRVRTASFALLFGLVSYANVAGYRSTYPTLHDRLELTRTFGDNNALRLFYGTPHDLTTAGGYAAWRVAGLLSIFAAVWALFAAVRAARAEEDAGRSELVLAGRVSRGGTYLAMIAALGAGAAILWAATLAGLVAGALPARGSAYLALAIVAVTPVFAGVGMLASQLAPTRRGATTLSMAVLGLAFLTRAVADTSDSLGGLRWATPFGWVEELRPFADTRPTVLLLPAIAAALLLVAAGLIAVGRDVGNGLLRAGETAAPRFGLLGSPTALALRGQRGNLAGWLVGTGLFAFVMGVLSKSVSEFHSSASVRRQLSHLGGASITTPSGYLALTFLFFVLALSLFACAQVAAARREEADQQLETLFARPVGRTAWLGGRLALATAGAIGVALTIGVLAWAGAASQNAGVSLPDMLEAGINLVPTALLFLALAAFAFALAPRASTAIAYGLVTITFVWELFGALLGAPTWALNASPFHHVAQVPTQALNLSAAGVILAVAAAAAVAALWVFRRRDLVGT